MGTCEKRIELGLVEAPTSMDAIVTGYKDGSFCIGRYGSVNEAESLAKQKGLDMARFFWFPQGENTIPTGYSEVNGWQNSPNPLREKIIQSLGSRGTPIRDIGNDNIDKRVYRVGRY